MMLLVRKDFTPADPRARAESLTFRGGTAYQIADAGSSVVIDQNAPEGLLVWWGVWKIRITAAEAREYCALDLPEIDMEAALPPFAGVTRVREARLRLDAAGAIRAFIGTVGGKVIHEQVSEDGIVRAVVFTLPAPPDDLALDPGAAKEDPT